MDQAHPTPDFDAAHQAAFSQFSTQLAELLDFLGVGHRTRFNVLLSEAMQAAAKAALTGLQYRWAVEYRSAEIAGGWIRDARQYPTREEALAAVRADQRDAELSANEDLRYQLVPVAKFESVGEPVPVDHRDPTTHQAWVTCRPGRECTVRIARVNPADGNAPYAEHAIVMPDTGIGSRHVGEYMETVDVFLKQAGWQTLIDWRAAGHNWYAFVVEA